MEIKLKTKGNYRKTLNKLTSLAKEEYMNSLDEYGQRGVEELAAATPIDTGKTSQSWSYRIENNRDIIWTNSNINEGVPIAVILQYGHGTGSGGYVPPNDYINPAMEPVMEYVGNDIWSEVTK